MNRALENLWNDSTEAAYWFFVAAEAAVVALADVEGIDVKKTHPSKFEAAQELARREIVPEGLPEILDVLTGCGRQQSMKEKRSISRVARSKTSRSSSSKPSRRLSDVSDRFLRSAWMQAESPGAWREKLVSDARAARDRQNTQLRLVTRSVVARARSAGARAVVLTGSTARGQRTAISDVDYYVVGGRRFDRPGSGDVDVLHMSVADFRARLRAGEDYAHWTVRFGCVLYDAGPIRQAFQLVGRQQLTPNPSEQFPRLRRALARAYVIAETDDDAAATEQIRETLTLAARWLLLSRDLLPLSRRELPAQLRRVGEDSVAALLQNSIRGDLDRRSRTRALSELARITGRHDRGAGVSSASERRSEETDRSTSAPR